MVVRLVERHRVVGSIKPREFLEIVVIVDDNLITLGEIYLVRLGIHNDIITYSRKLRDNTAVCSIEDVKITGRHTGSDIKVLC